MKVLQFYKINWHNPGFGGGVRYVNLLTRGLRQHGVGVVLVGCGGESITTTNLRYISIYTNDKISHWKFVFRSFIFCFFRKTDVDIIHFHRSYHVWVLLLKRSKRVLTLHGRTFSLAKDRFGFMFKIVRPVYELIEYLSLSMFDEIVFVSHDVRNDFLSKYPQLISKYHRVIGSMLELEVYQDSQQPRSGKHIVLSLGRLAEVKNLELFIDVAREAKRNRMYNLEFWIVGDGESASKLKAYAEDLVDDGYLHFKGVIKPEGVPAILYKSSVLLLTSRHEASPTVIKEALASGTPVITTRVGDVEDYINDLNGFVVEEDPKAFLQRIRDCLELGYSRQSIKTASIAGLAKVSVNFISGKYKELYQSLC